MEEPTVGLIGEEDGEFANVLRSILSMQMEAEGLPLPANIAKPTSNVHAPPKVDHDEHCALLEQYVSELLPCVKLVGNSSGLNLEERKQAIKFAADAGMAKRAAASQPTPCFYGWTQALTQEVLTMAEVVEHSVVESTAAGGSDVMVTSSDSEECSSTCDGVNATFASKEKEMMYRVASMRPVVADTWLRKEVELSRPKRRNVRISKEPQTVAARKRRERIGDRIRMLQRLVPGSTKLDTASMLDEAVHYLKFLKMEVQALHNTFIQLNNTPTTSTTTTTTTTTNHTPYPVVFPMNTNPMNIDPSQPPPIATTSFDPHMGFLMPNCPTLPPFSSFDPNHLQQSCH